VESGRPNQESEEITPMSDHQNTNLQPDFQPEPERGRKAKPGEMPRPKDEIVSGAMTPPIQINIPPKVDLSRFASGMHDEGEVEAVAQLHEPLSVKKFQEVKDYVWVHPDPAYTSSKPYFLVEVPSDEKKGKPSLELIDLGLARQYLTPGQWLRMNFCLASLPGNKQFLGIVPCRNLDNDFNKTMLKAIEQAKTGWRRILRLHDKDGYWAKPPEEANFADPPEWSSQTLEELVYAHFHPHKLIMTAEHPSLLRLRGKKQRID
jgi:hypothetical protein